MNDIPFLERNHDPDGCQQDRIQELEEVCDNEYYMSTNPELKNRERVLRGRLEIFEGIKEFKHLLEIATCSVCRMEIEKQILLQEEGLQEIDAVLKH